MESSVKFLRVDLDPRVNIATCIYRKKPHETTNLSGIASSSATAEMLRFVRDYANFIDAGDQPFFRLDVQVANGQLVVLEVNAAFVDGWGTAFNLSRAAGMKLDMAQIGFPTCFGLEETAYLPELNLLIRELDPNNVTPLHVCPDWRNCPDSRRSYVYGRVSDVSPDILPYNGLAFDDKRHLVRFSQGWHSDLVTTPQHYTVADTPWTDVPREVYLKFADKSSPECLRTGFSVQRGRPDSKGGKLRSRYNEGKLIAQACVYGERVDPNRNGHPLTAQLVVLTNGEMLCGYTQYAGGEIINDNSIHGPLVFL